MSRVLLFVQTGEARPKCVSRSVGFDPAERLQGQQWLPGCEFYVWWSAHATAMRADRWWLVEAPDAEMGRMIIGSCPLDDSRILASGGRP